MRKLREPLYFVITASLVVLTMCVQPVLPMAVHQQTVNAIGSTLPYWLDGTILDGSKRVVVTWNGRAPHDLARGDFDYVLNFRQEQQILDSARARYIAAYNIDPYQVKEVPTIHVNTIGANQFNDVVKPSGSSLGSGPHKFCWRMELKVFFADDDDHRPVNINELKAKTKQGWNRFFQFSMLPVIQYYYGLWSAYGSGTNSFAILDDLTVQCDKYQRHYYQIVLGWVRTADHNGCTYLPNFFVVCSENCWPDAPKDILIQHELSHAIGAIPDDPIPDSDIGWHRGGFNPCLVNYYYLYSGTTTWCTTCKKIMQHHINYGK